MRSYEESCAYLDEIVGRCVRDEKFAASVLEDPESALKQYQLSEDELDDFRALKYKHGSDAAESWATIRAGMVKIGGRNCNGC